MNADTVESLKALGCQTICLNCLNEDFEYFMAYQGQVLWCEACCPWIKDERIKEPLKIALLDPTLQESATQP